MKDAALILLEALIRVKEICEESDTWEGDQRRLARIIGAEIDGRVHLENLAKALRVGPAVESGLGWLIIQNAKLYERNQQLQKRADRLARGEAIESDYITRQDDLLIKRLAMHEERANRLAKGEAVPTDYECGLDDDERHERTNKEFGHVPTFQATSEPAQEKPREVNACKCRNCGDVIRSFSRHDFKACKCGKVMVDGGNEYIRRIGEISQMIELKTLDDYERAIREQPDEPA
jgi:hypothetical protein